MDASYFRLLTAEVQSMVLAVESAVGQEIVVRKRDTQDIALPGLANMATLITECSPGSLSFSILLGSQVAPHVLAHEVAHAWLKGCSQTICIGADEADRTAFNLANLVSNDIEHLAVIPFEISLSTDARDYWASLYRRLAEALDSEPNANRVRGNGLRLLALAEIALQDKPLSEMIRQTLHRTHVLDEAEQFVRELGQTHGDVSQAMRVAARYLLQNPARYHFLQYSPSGCTRIAFE